LCFFCFFFSLFLCSREPFSPPPALFLFSCLLFRDFTGAFLILRFQRPARTLGLFFFLAPRREANLLAVGPRFFPSPDRGSPVFAYLLDDSFFWFQASAFPTWLLFCTDFLFYLLQVACPPPINQVGGSGNSPGSKLFLTSSWLSSVGRRRPFFFFCRFGFVFPSRLPCWRPSRFGLLILSGTCTSVFFLHLFSFSFFPFAVARPGRSSLHMIPSRGFLDLPRFPGVFFF